MKYEVVINFKPVIAKVEIEPEGDTIDMLNKTLIEGTKHYPSDSIQSVSVELVSDDIPTKIDIDPDNKPVGFGASIHYINKDKP